MKITGINIGYHAANSSSTSAIIPLADIDEELAKYVVATERLILDMVLATVYSVDGVLSGTDPEMTDALLRITEEYWPRATEGFSDVDQQMPLFPINFRTGAIQATFLKQFVQWLQDYAVIVYDRNQPPQSPAEPELIRNLRGQQFIARQDRCNPRAWELYAPDTGAFMQFVFAGDYEWASVPRSIDIKITNYCEYGCPFCYQSSSAGHRPTQRVNGRLFSFLDACQRAGVMAVALGGGEPTTWEGYVPGFGNGDFIDLLLHISGLGLIPSFSTRDVDFLTSWDFERVLPDIGAAALSVSAHNIADLEFLAAHHRANHSMSTEKFHIHVPMGTLNRDEFAEVLKHAFGYKVVLLGFKRVGRGAHYEPQPYDWWHEEIQERPYLSIGVDSVLMGQYPALASNTELFWEPDGRFTAAYDTETNILSPSSYETGLTLQHPALLVPAWLDLLSQQGLRGE